MDPPTADMKEKCTKGLRFSFAQMRQRLSERWVQNARRRYPGWSLRKFCTAHSSLVFLSSTQHFCASLCSPAVGMSTRGTSTCRHDIPTSWKWKRFQRLHECDFFWQDLSVTNHGRIWGTLGSVNLDVVGSRVQTIAKTCPLGICSASLLADKN